MFGVLFIKEILQSKLTYVYLLIYCMATTGEYVTSDVRFSLLSHVVRISECPLVTLICRAAMGVKLT